MGRRFCFGEKENSMDIIEELKKMSKQLEEKQKSVPKCIEVTKRFYCVLEQKTFWDRLIDGKTKQEIPFGFGIRVIVQDDFSEWTEEEIKQGFKAIF